MREQNPDHSDEPETERERGFQQFLDFLKDKANSGKKKVKEKVMEVFELRKYRKP